MRDSSLEPKSRNPLDAKHVTSTTMFFKEYAETTKVVRANHNGLDTIDFNFLSAWSCCMENIACHGNVPQFHSLVKIGISKAFPMHLVLFYCCFLASATTELILPTTAEACSGAWKILNFVSAHL